MREFNDTVRSHVIMKETASGVRLDSKTSGSTCKLQMMALVANILPCKFPPWSHIALTSLRNHRCYRKSHTSLTSFVCFIAGSVAKAWYLCIKCFSWLCWPVENALPCFSLLFFSQWSIWMKYMSLICIYKVSHISVYCWYQVIPGT